MIDTLRDPPAPLLEAAGAAVAPAPPVVGAAAVTAAAAAAAGVAGFAADVASASAPPPAAAAAAPALAGTPSRSSCTNVAMASRMGCRTDTTGVQVGSRGRKSHEASLHICRSSSSNSSSSKFSSIR